MSSPPLTNLGKCRSFRGGLDNVKYGNINFVRIPYLPGLRTSDIVEFAEKHVDIRSYLPEYKKPRFPSRQWVCNLGKLKKVCDNVVATLIENEYKDFVRNKTEEIEQEYAIDRNTKFQAIPQFVNAIRDSTSLSSKPINKHFVETNGRFHSLVNNSKRCRDNNEKEKQKQVKVMELRERVTKQEKEIDKMMAKLQDFETLNAEMEDYEEKLNRLYKMGIIDSEGFPIQKEDM